MASRRLRGLAVRACVLSSRLPRARSTAMGLLLAWSASNALATTYYAAVSGSRGNSGLSTSSPWPLSYALGHVASGDTIIVMPGVYTGDVEVTTPNLTLKSQVKWGATMANLPYGIACGYSGDATGTVVDGFEIANASSVGIQFRNSNCVARNCWIHGSGAGHPNQNGSGITTSPVDNTLIENNLLEYNGWQATYDHGVYIAGGKNVVIRNNVCRYNAASGIQVYGNGGVPVNTQIYNNLCYGNANWGIVCGTSGNPIYIYNNTVIGGHSGTAIGAGQSTQLMLTNNILIAGTAVFNIWSGSASGDWNLLNTSELSQAHGLVSTPNNFVNTANGLYWLNSSSPARGRALSTVHGPADFFGNPQSSVADLGAFQYTAAYAADTRVLDPTPAGGANYWQVLSGSSGTPAIGLTPHSQSFGSIQVGTTEDLAFTVMNTGSAALSGSASVVAPFAVVSGGSYSLNPGQSQTVTIRFSPTSSGSAGQNVLFTGAAGTNAAVSGIATNGPSGGFAFQANAGTITAPFIITNGCVCQLVDTENANGGRAVYNFTTSTAGVYIVSAVVNAPTVSANSFYVTIDGAPTEAYNVWDIPVTSGFQTQTVSWRGNGVGESDEFAPKAFALPAGNHSLLIMGREPNVLLQSIQIQPSTFAPPTPPQSLAPLLTQ